MVVKRRKRGKNEQNLYLIAKLQTDIEKIGETEYEISKERYTRGNKKFNPIIREDRTYN